MANPVPMINAQLDVQNQILARMAAKMGALDNDLTWKELQLAVRGGTARMYADVGEQLNVEAAETLNVEVSGTGVTAATVSKDTFLAAAGTHKHIYEFVYNGATWHYDGDAVVLADYGITPTGTAAEGDEIIVTRTATAAAFDVEGHDEEVPVNPALTHTLSILRHDIMGTIVFDPAQLLYVVEADTWPSGMPAGTYNITLDHAAYDGGTGEDGTYEFTTTQTIPVGGGLRHSNMGKNQTTYAGSNITGGTITTYDADGITTIESNIAVTSGTSGTSLGTTTCKDPQYKVGDSVNFTQRQQYGSGRWSTSYIRQRLNSEDATFTFTKGTKWSRPVSGTFEGFLHSLDPELRAVLGKVRKRYALGIADGYGYEDIEDTVTLATMLDIFGDKNNNISEGPVDASGTVKRTTQTSLWKGTTNAQKIKKNNGSAASWWLSSVYPTGANYARLVNSSGALDHGNVANNAHGAVPRLTII